MNNRPLSAIPRRRASLGWLPLLLLLVPAMLFAASHCELGGMKSAAPSEHSCCAESGKPTPAKTYAPCCDAVQGVLPDLLGAPPATWAFSLEIPLPSAPAGLPVASPVGLFGSLPGAHGPPGGVRFLRILLARSMPALAPPAGWV